MCVILGCTELSLAQEREPITDLPLVDSQSTLVDRTIEWADKTQKECELKQVALYK